MLNIGDGKTNWKGKGILKTTGGRPVICKHSEKSNKRKIIDEEENSSKLIKRRRKLNYLGNRMSKLVQNALYRKRNTNNIDDQNNKLNYLVSKIVRNESCRKRKTNDVGNKSSKKKKNNNDLDQHICTRTIQIGDSINLSDLLFTKKRNYLFNYKLNKRVRAKDLAGSVVVLYFVLLGFSQPAVMTHLLDIYSKLKPRGGFEIVFVAISDDREDISSDATKQLSEMPWPAIPLSDLKSRERLQRIFGISSRPKDIYKPPSFTIDPRGVVLQCDSTPFFIRYGAAGYPFTNERIEFLDSEDNAVQMQPLSIQNLLGSPQRDYLIDNDGEQVTLDYLDDKVVGLYFCPYLHQSYPTEQFEDVYDELETREDFEIVLVYVQGWYEEEYHGRTDEAMFLKAFKDIPWLALPFDDTDCNKKLQRIFKYPQKKVGGHQPNPMLVIIGPNGKFIEPLGGQILLEYGVPAYPFTTSSTVNLELERVKKLKPEMLWDLDSVFRHYDGSQVPFSQLVGKRIIVIFHNTYLSYKFTIKKLKERYVKMKGTDDEFEVIHILGWENLEARAPVPWLMHPPFNRDSYAKELTEKIFRRGYGLLAFDRDGSVVRRTEVLEFGDTMIFPFYHNEDMEKEVLLEVETYSKRKIRGDDDGIGTVYY